MLDNKKNALLYSGLPFDKALLGAAEEFAIECALLKVFGSELIDFCVDEGVQIHGGNGFSDEYEISRAYRDSRINRIYEGTNEINRLLSVSMILKRAAKGSLDLMTAAMAVSKELISIPGFHSNGEATLFSNEKKYIRNFKKAILLVSGAAVQKFMMDFDKEQEIIMNIADMLIYTFTAESALLRVQKQAEFKGADAIVYERDILNVYLYDAADLICKAGKDALHGFAQGDTLRMMHTGLKRFTRVEPFNIKEARRRIADKMVEEGGYCF